MSSTLFHASDNMVYRSSNTSYYAATDANLSVTAIHSPESTVAERVLYSHCGKRLGRPIEVL